MFFFLGSEGGTSLYGILFQAIGTRSTLLIFGSISGVMLAAFLVYLKISANAPEYEKLPSDNEDDDSAATNGDNNHNFNENYQVDK